MIPGRQRCGFADPDPAFIQSVYVDPDPHNWFYVSPPSVAMIVINYYVKKIFLFENEIFIMPAKKWFPKEERLASVAGILVPLTRVLEQTIGKKTIPNVVIDSGANHRLEDDFKFRHWFWSKQLQMSLFLEQTIGWKTIQNVFIVSGANNRL